MAIQSPDGGSLDANALISEIIAQERASLAQRQQSSYGSGTVLMVPRGTLRYGRMGPANYRTGTGPRVIYENRPKSVPIDDFVQEFYDKWEDPKFQSWFMSRTLASGRTNAKSTYEDYLNQWVDLGKSTAQGMFRGTPEQFLEWMATGQRVSADDIRRQIEEGAPAIDPVTGDPVLPTEEQYGGTARTEPVNPITTYRSTSSATINREAAYAAVDQLSQALLGRMATKGEMRRARRVMNRMLAENPTVTTTTRDATDPNNITETSHTTDGMSAADAQAALQMDMQRSSEGTAFTVGTMFEDAMRLLASKEG